jgi:hypothetical protein
MRLRSTIFCSLLLLVPACGDDDSAPDANTTPDANLAPDAGVDANITPDANLLDDNNDSFGEAVAVPTAAPNQVSGVIQVDNDVDYYSVVAAADQWLLISTDANPDDDPAKIDTVITLYNPSQTQVASNDDAQPRVNTDSEIVYHVVTAGTYYVKVQEYGSWLPSDSVPPSSGP